MWSYNEAVQPFKPMPCSCKKMLLIMHFVHISSQPEYQHSSLGFLVSAVQDNTGGQAGAVIFFFFFLALQANCNYTVGLGLTPLL